MPVRAYDVDGKAWRFDADAFRRMRARLRASHADIAACVGVTRAAVSAWERGVCCPRAETVETLVDMLGTTEFLRRMR